MLMPPADAYRTGGRASRGLMISDGGRRDGRERCGRDGVRPRVAQLRSLVCSSLSLGELAAAGLDVCTVGATCAAAAPRLNGHKPCCAMTILAHACAARRCSSSFPHLTPILQQSLWPLSCADEHRKDLRLQGRSAAPVVRRSTRLRDKQRGGHPASPSPYATHTPPSCSTCIPRHSRERDGSACCHVGTRCRTMRSAVATQCRVAAGSMTASISILAATLTAAPRSYDAATSLAGRERRMCLTACNSLVE